MRTNDQRNGVREGLPGPALSGAGPIVVDIDGFGSGREAIAWADREAKLRGLNVRVLSGMEPERFLAASEEASMIVVGSVGLLRMRDLAEGSDAMAVALHANVPVVVVHPSLPTSAGEGPSTGRVVVGVDGGELSGAAVEFAFAEARDHDCGVTLVHAVEREKERTAAGTMLSRLAAGHADVRTVVVVDTASRALIEESEGARLVVVGSRGYGGLRGMLLGSVSQAVVHRARCPVAVVRSHSLPNRH